MRKVAQKKSKMAPCGVPSRAGRNFLLGCAECDFVVLKGPSVLFREANKWQRVHVILIYPSEFW